MKLALIAVVALALSVTAIAQQTITESFGTGTIRFTYETSGGQCPISQGTYPPDMQPYTEYEFSSFVYTDGNGVTDDLGNIGGAYFQSPGGPSCPPNGPTATETQQGYGFDISFTPCDGPPCSPSYSSVPSGYVDPKYIITAIVYAPPGADSYVKYGGSASVGNSTAISSSLSESVSSTTTLSWGGAIFAWLEGSPSYKDTVTSAASSTNGNSSSVTTTMNLSETSYSQFAGIGQVPWSGWWSSGFNPHGFDQAVLWLNPVLVVEAPSGTPVTWNGYGYDYCDQGPYMDIFPVQLGTLDGDLPMSPTESSYLGRGWASGSSEEGCAAQVMSSGSAALDSTDYANIVAADPVYNQSYELNLDGGNTSADGRYTAAGGIIQNGQVTTTTDFPFEQEEGGAGPDVSDYDVAYTKSMDIKKTTSLATSESYGVTQALSGSLFFINFSSSLADSSKLTLTYETQNVFTTSTSKFAEVHIVGPPCSWTGSACNPSYAGPGEFDMFQDNLFGTFMFWPVD